MPVDVILFLLRVISGLLLFSFLLALFFLIWREYRVIAKQINFNRTTYGRLVEFTQVDSAWVPTGTTYPLRPLTTLGRAPTNEVVINNSFSSSEHALIALRDGQWWLEDRNSRNGTLLNDEAIVRNTIITHLDMIQIGEVTFRVELEN